MAWPKVPFVRLSEAAPECAGSPRWLFSAAPDLWLVGGQESG